MIGAVRLLGLVLLLGVLARPATAAPLVDVAWVKQHIGKPNHVFLDVRSRSAYARAHVPGAVHTRYGGDGWRVKRGGVPGMLPGAAELEKLIGELGISNADHVTVLPGGYSAGEMGVATRIYWTFKVSGHGRVSILDGGMTAYLGDRTAPRSQGVERRKPTVFKVDLDRQFLATKSDVHEALSTGSLLIDARPSGQYLGINKSKSVRYHGTLKGAVNVPGEWTTVDDGGRFRSQAAMAKLFEALGVPTDGDAVFFCNTGHWASLGWFVQSEILGNQQARMYDGSMSEWTKDAANPVEKKVSLEK